MASFSRSGETLLLRCLNGHRNISVVHQIRHPDTQEDVDLFNHLMEREDQTIAIDDPLVLHKNLNENSILLLKNAVWTHKYHRRGFALVRNPFSVLMSSKRVNVSKEMMEGQKVQQFRWARLIDKRLVALQGSEETRIGFLALYAFKMMSDRKEGLPFVRYEDFVGNPELYLRKIIAHLGLKWDPKVLSSHEDYEEGEKGHGSIKLWKPIHQGSTDKYKQMTGQIHSLVYAMCADVLEAYGYKWENNHLSTVDVEGMI